MLFLNTKRDLGIPFLHSFKDWCINGAYRVYQQIDINVNSMVNDIDMYQQPAHVLTDQR